MRSSRSCLALAQAVLVDSVDEPDARDGIERACALSGQAYVVDLAWLRSTPWRERIAAAFDPPRLRPELRRSRASASATTPTRRSRRCSSSAGWPRAWAGRRTRSRRQDALAGTRPRRASAAMSRCAWRRHRSCRCAGLQGLTLQTEARTRAEPGPRAAEACTRATGRAAARSASGRSSAPPAARPASSARASARRCCATPPTCRRCGQPGAAGR